MKRLISAIILFLSLLFFGKSASAQISFDRSDFEARIGQTFTFSDFSATDLSGIQALVDLTGSDKTWDFTTIPFAIDSTASNRYVALPATLPGSDDPLVASATFAIEITSGSDTEASFWAYFGLTDTALLGYGGAAMVNGTLFKNFFDTPITVNSIPFTFGSTWSSTATQTIVIQGITLTTTTTQTGNVDSYGTLVTPAGTVDCIRYELQIDIETAGFTTTTYSLVYASKSAISAVIVLDASRTPIAASYSTEEGVATGIESVDANIPETFKLYPSYPNPFEASTTIRFDIAETAPVQLDVYDLLGREVATLVNERLTPGPYRYVWNATGMPGGIYLYRIKAGAFTDSGSLVVQK